MQRTRVIRKLLDVIFPVACVTCDREGMWLCRRCFAAAPLDGRRRCPVCFAAGARHPTCPHPLSQLIVAGPYADSSIAPAIQGLKFSYLTALAKPLGLLLARSLAPHLHRAAFSPILVPIPLHPRRERARGFNQSRSIARCAGVVLDLPVADTLLTRQRQTLQQSTLDRDARRRNLAGAFAVPGGISRTDRTFILIDDVCTSGATLTAAARVLEHAGARSIWGATIASDAPLYRNASDWYSTRATRASSH